MSKNRNRAKLNKAKNNHEYRILWLKEKFPPYYDEGWNWKTNISNQDRRAFRSWKHNRKTQWK